MTNNSERDFTFNKVAGVVYCKACGSKIIEEAVICPNCGVPNKRIPNSTINADSKEKLTAGLLAIFLGTFGVHKFYLGRIGMGIVYILFFWTYIPTILGVIEGIVYLSMSQDNFDAKFNN